jgi:hypothetical protein
MSAGEHNPGEFEFGAHGEGEHNPGEPDHGHEEQVAQPGDGPDVTELDTDPAYAPDDDTLEQVKGG